MRPFQFTATFALAVAFLIVFWTKEPGICYCNCGTGETVSPASGLSTSHSKQIAASISIAGEECGLPWDIVIYKGMAFVCMEVEGTDGQLFTYQQAIHHGKSRQEVSKIAMLVLSAPDSDSLYKEMATMTQNNKQRYCQIHGYDLYVEDRMAVNKTLWATKAATRTEAYAKHLHKHEWMWWTDSDVVLTNAAMRIEKLLDGLDAYDFVCTKDWMGRGGQLNSGVIFLRNSVSGWRFLKMWRDRMEQPDQLDDQASLIAMLNENPDVHARVKYLTQYEMNSYSHLVTRDGSIGPEPEEHGHDYYKPGDFAVHNVNCLRAWHVRESLACLGIIGYYDHIFTASLQDAWKRRVVAFKENRTLQNVFEEDNVRSTRHSKYWVLDESKVPNTSAKLLEKPRSE